MDVLKQAGRRCKKVWICTYPPVLWVVDGQVLVCIHTRFPCQSHLGRSESLNLAANVL